MKCSECRAETSDAAPYCATCGAPTTGRSAVVRAERLRIAGGIAGVVAAFPVGAVIFLPSFYYHGTAFTLLHGIPSAFALEPLGVAIVVFFTGLVLAWGRSGAWSVAAGMLLAFGIQMSLFSIGTQWGYSPPETAGSAGIAGFVGALLLVSGGVLGVVGISAQRTASAFAANQGIGGWPNTFNPQGPSA